MFADGAMWAFPAWQGDHRLIQEGEGSRLLVMDPTEHERQLLNEFLQKAFKKKWVGDTSPGVGLGAPTIQPDDKTREVALAVPVAKAGKILVKLFHPGKATLTAVKYEAGKLLVTEGNQETAIDAVLDEKKKAKAAVSVRRPTISCPNCLPGSVGPASEVLQQFLSPEQHESWSKSRELIAIGGLSGHRYILSHRNTRRAIANRRICYDVDSRAILHFHDWSVPPEEEVLAAKLILEHREPWLRNEASLFHLYTEGRVEPLFKNPFGNLFDGTSDAALVKAFGQIAKAILQPASQPIHPPSPVQVALPKAFKCQIPAWA